jgi:hypothetical protein
MPKDKDARWTKKNDESFYGKAAKRVVRIEAADNRASVPDTRRAERRQLVGRLRALQAEARDCPDGATKAALAQAREALRLLDSGR